MRWFDRKASTHCYKCGKLSDNYYPFYFAAHEFVITICMSCAKKIDDDRNNENKSQKH